MKSYARVFAQIDLDAIVYNLEQMKKNLDADTQIMAVIKTDGYGHGAVAIAKKIEPIPYIIGFAVATAEEAFQLRRHGITKKILILGVYFEEQYEQLIEQNITLNIFQAETAVHLSKIATRLDKTVSLHLKLDTGMSRLGVPPSEEAVQLAKQIAACDHIKLEGIFTHFSKADETDKQPSYAQLKAFLAFIEKCREEGLYFQYQHCSNSAAIIDLRQANMNFVRAGISLYGLYPSGEVNKNAVPLKPVLSLKSKVVYLKEIPAGQAVGYGGTYVAPHAMKVATIPVGYGDGYPRGLSNKGDVLIRGQRAPIIGRICMDQFMVDVTHIEDVQLMDEAVLVGDSQKARINVDELSGLCGRFNYEFVCDLGKRIPRVFVENGIVTNTMDYFEE